VVGVLVDEVGLVVVVVVVDGSVAGEDEDPAEELDVVVGDVVVGLVDCGVVDAECAVVSLATKRPSPIAATVAETPIIAVPRRTRVMARCRDCAGVRSEASDGRVRAMTHLSSRPVERATGSCLVDRRYPH
jgi:hypothetical protein